jgi:O-antigen/teichoic acid export membrane protein
MAGDVVRSSWVRNMFDGRLAKGVGYNFFATMFLQGSTFLASIALANIFGRLDFGKYALLQGSFVSISVLATAASGFTATKYVAEFRGVDPAKVGRILGLLQRLTIFTGIAAALLFALAAPFTAGSVFRAEELTLPLVVGSLGIPFATMSAHLMGSLAGFEAFRSLARGALASGCLYVLATTLGAALFGLTGAAFGLGVSAFGQWAIMHRVLRETLLANGIALGRRGYDNERRVVLRFALPAAIAGYYTTAMVWAAGVLLARTADGFVQFALYSAALNAKTIVLIAPNVINGVGLAILNNQRRDAPTEYRSAFLKNVLFVWGSTIAAAALLAVFGTGFLSIYGEGFADGYPVLLFLMAAAVFDGLSIAVYQHIVVRAQMWLSFWAIVVPRDTVLVGLAYALAPTSGALGLAEAYFIASLWGVTSTALFLLATNAGTRLTSCPVEHEK